MTIYFFPPPSFEWFVLHAQIIGKNIKQLNIWRPLDQEYAKYGPWAKSSLPCVSVNKFYWNTAHAFTYWQWLLSCDRVRAEKLWQRLHDPQRLKCLISGPCIEKVCWTLIDKWLTFPFSFCFVFFFTFDSEYSPFCSLIYLYPIQLCKILY